MAAYMMFSAVWTYVQTHNLPLCGINSGRSPPVVEKTTTLPSYGTSTIYNANIAVISPRPISFLSKSFLAL
jgi:hypothetical protein